MLREQNRGGIVRIRTNTTITPAGKVRVKTTVKAAPMLPTLKASTTYSIVPSAAPAGNKKRRAKKR
jgi:hypothetical protein